MGEDEKRYLDAEAKEIIDGLAERFDAVDGIVTLVWDTYSCFRSKGANQFEALQLTKLVCGMKDREDR